MMSLRDYSSNPKNFKIEIVDIMNIFILDNDISKNVLYHADKHVIKMILESAQMLSTAVRLSGIDAGYKPTHIKHPCVLWVSSSLSNWRWLLDLTKGLNEEWRYRYNHKNNHKSFDVATSLPEPNIDDIGITPFAVCMPDDVKIDNDPVKSYRNYYKINKSHIHSWKNREIPEWIK